MKKSWTYYLTLWVIKLKGVKKAFETDPIDYKELRKDNIHVPPKKYARQQLKVESWPVLNTTITELSSEDQPQKLVLFVHGGAFVYGPVQHHWETVGKIAKKTGHTDLPPENWSI